MLITKFHIPAVGQQYVSRPRLLEMLDRSFQQNNRLTLISAPAGYGKSTLVSEWIHSHLEATPDPYSFTWLSLDDSDNDPVQFLRYVLGAICAQHPLIGQDTLSYLGLQTLPPMERILSPLMNELAALSEPLILVLDDYHRITNEAVHNILRFLVDSAPDPFKLVVITREDPPLLLSRLRTRRQITEVRVDQLRFLSHETGSFFQRQDLPLPANWLSVLEKRTEGWVSGLLLAAISMQGRDNLTNFFAQFGGSHRLVFDYLMDEVLSRLPEDTHRFLLYTAVLDQFTAPLCEAVTGFRNARAILLEIEKANLFLIPLDDQRIWYRYHHLFADALKADLERTEPDRLVELNRRAAIWLNENNQPTEAIQHAQAAGDLALVVAIIRKWIASREHAGSYAELVGWFSKVPNALLADDLPLLYRKLRVFYRSGDYERCEQIRQFIEVQLDQLPDQQSEDVRSLRVNVLFEKAVFASMRSQLTEAQKYLEQASLLALPDKPHEQLQLAFYQGINYASMGEFEHALDAYQVCFDLNIKEGFIWNAANCLANMLDIYCMQGRFQYAIQTGENFIIRYRKALSTPRYLEGLNAAIGTAYYLTNQLDLAEARLQQTLDSSKTSGSDDNYGGWRLRLAEICSAKGKTEEAEALIQQSEPWVEGFPGEQYQLYAGAIRVRIRLGQGDLSEPRRWATRYMLERGRPYFKAMQDHTLAWLWLLEGKFGDALTLLSECQTEMERCGANGYLVENMALQALTLHQLVRNDEALALLWRSLSLASGEHQDRIFLNLGEKMAELLKLLRAKQPKTEPSCEIVLRLIGSAAQEMAQTPACPSSPLVEPVVERELEILRLIAAGLSNQAIADRLNLSISTIKWYTYHLYEKLDVNSRTQAVQRARELNLL